MVRADRNVVIVSRFPIQLRVSPLLKGATAKSMNACEVDDQYIQNLLYDSLHFC